MNKNQKQCTALMKREETALVNFDPPMVTDIQTNNHELIVRIKFRPFAINGYWYSFQDLLDAIDSYLND